MAAMLRGHWLSDAVTSLLIYEEYIPRPAADMCAVFVIDLGPVAEAVAKLVDSL